MNIPKPKNNIMAGKGTGMNRPEYDIVEAAKQNKDDIVEKILSEDPEKINDQDPVSGMTALHWVGANINYDLGVILFSQQEPKVDPFIQDSYGRYAFDLANEMGDERVIELFFKNIPEEPENNVVNFEGNDGPGGMG